MGALKNSNRTTLLFIFLNVVNTFLSIMCAFSVVHKLYLTIFHQTSSPSIESGDYTLAQEMKATQLSAVVKLVSSKR